MYQHYGHNVTITNNIFALGTGGVGEVWQHGNSGNAGPEGVSDLNFETNIVYVDARVGPALFGGSWLGNSSFKSNLYWNASATDSAKSLADAQQFPSWKQGTQHGAPGSGEGACNRTFSQWQQSGEDAGSVIADPGFASHSATPRRPEDFQIGGSSPARKLGAGNSLLCHVLLTKNRTFTKTGLGQTSENLTTGTFLQGSSRSS